MLAGDHIVAQPGIRQGGKIIPLRVAAFNHHQNIARLAIVAGIDIIGRCLQAWLFLICTASLSFAALAKSTKSAEAPRLAITRTAIRRAAALALLHDQIICFLHLLKTLLQFADIRCADVHIRMIFLDQGLICLFTSSSLAEGGTPSTL